MEKNVIIKFPSGKTAIIKIDSICETARIEKTGGDIKWKSF